MPEIAWAALKRARVRWTNSRFQSYQVNHTYYGFPLDVTITNPLSQSWYDHDWPRMPELDQLSAHKLRPGARVFDLGAHQCVVALMLSRIVGPTGHVLAVEACREDAEAGRRNQELNGADNLEILHAAVAAQTGPITFTLDAHVDTPSQKSAKVTVDGYSIDDLASRYGAPDVLFIDVEGYECQALKGAERTLRQKPDCFVEVHVGVGLENFGASVEDVLGFFPREEFDWYGCLPDGLQFAPLTSESTCLRQHFYLIAIAR
ncbi:MAG: FkbM family methyltransferase [Acidobacteriia bacterium]|nr:FkbM family methyltransferase [Terriglobia bacterium]